MPKVDEINATQLSTLKDKLNVVPATGEVDKTFDEKQDVSLEEVVSQTPLKNLGKWVGITAKLYNFAIGEETGGTGATGNDDVQYLGICKCPRPRASRTLEVTDLPEREAVVADQIFGTFGTLHREGKVRFGVVTNAFNNDSSEAWDGIVTALGGDVKKALSLGIDLLPGLSEFQTPGAVGRAITALVVAGLTDQPVKVSDDKVLLDTIEAKHWYRKVDQADWTIRKWVVHTLDNRPAWYLSQWFITLSTEIREYDYIASANSEFLGLLGGALLASADQIKADAAALSVLVGVPLNVAAEALGVREYNVASALASLRAASTTEAMARVHSVVLAGIKLPLRGAVES